MILFGNTFMIIMATFYLKLKLLDSLLSFSVWIYYICYMKRWLMQLPERKNFVCFRNIPNNIFNFRVFGTNIYNDESQLKRGNNEHAMEWVCIFVTFYACHLKTLFSSFDFYFELYFFMFSTRRRLWFIWAFKFNFFAIKIRVHRLVWLKMLLLWI